MKNKSNFDVTTLTKSTQCNFKVMPYFLRLWSGFWYHAATT